MVLCVDWDMQIVGTVLRTLQTLEIQYSFFPWTTKFVTSLLMLEHSVVSTAIWFVAHILKCNIMGRTCALALPLFRLKKIILFLESKEVKITGLLLLFFFFRSFCWACSRKLIGCTGAFCSWKPSGMYSWFKKIWFTVKVEFFLTFLYFWIIQEGVWEIS